MRAILSIAALVGGLLLADGASAESPNDAPFDVGGTNGMQIGNSMSEPMIVDVDTGNLREAPRPQAHILTTLGRGTRVTVVGTANGGGWAHALVDGLDGYIDFVQLAKAPPAADYGEYSAMGRPMVVAASQGSIRARPNPRSEILMTLPRGARVVVLRESEHVGWALVHAYGTRGYMDDVELADARAIPYGTTPYAAYMPTYPVYESAYPAYESSYPVYGTAAPTYQPADMVVSAAGGAIHQEPDIRSPLLSTLPPGYRVSVIGSANGRWAHVVANGVDGYMDYSQLQ